MFVESLEELVHQSFPKLRGLLNQYRAILMMELLHKVLMQPIFILLGPVILQIQFEVNLIREQVIFSSAVVVLQERVIGSIGLFHDFPFRFLLHVFLMRMQQMVQTFLFVLLQLRVYFFFTIFNILQPFLAVFFGLLDVVWSAIVVALDTLAEKRCQS